jgi:immune inhibitor A
MKKIVFSLLFCIILSINLSALMPPLNGDFSSFKKSSVLMSRQFKFDAKNLKQPKGQTRIIAILMDFPDYRWNHTSDTLFENDSLWYDKAHFDLMLSSVGTYRHPGSFSAYTGSMRDYYRKCSFDSVDIIVDVIGYFTAINNFAYYCEDYGTNDWYLIDEALDSANKYVDFSDYDNDSDGYVDGVFIIHAGPGAEALPEPDRIHYIWSYMSYWGSSYDGVTVGTYSMQPEDGAIGVFCHEFGHQLGLPDWYDYDYSSQGIGEWGLMAGGSWGCKNINDLHGTSPSIMCGVGKYWLGFINPYIVTDNMINVTIQPAENSPVAYLLKDASMASTEYFIIENRQNLSFDASLTRRQIELGKDLAHGLVIFHVDESRYDNDDETAKQVDVEEASPYFNGVSYYEHLDYERTYPAYEKLYNGNRGDNGDAWPGYSSFTADTEDFSNRDLTDFNMYSHPSSYKNSGVYSLVGIENISESDTFIEADMFVKVSNNLISPSSSEVLTQSEIYLIEWQSSAAGGVLYDSLYYNVNGGAWIFIEKDTTSENTFSWTVPSVISDSCRIKIVTSNSKNNKATFISGLFKIEPSSSVLLDTKGEDMQDALSENRIFTSIREANEIIKRLGYMVFDISGNRIEKITKSGKYFTLRKSNQRETEIKQILILN